MNYRHVFHAGNFADVFKHVVLSRVLVYLTARKAPSVLSTLTPARADMISRVRGEPLAGMARRDREDVRRGSPRAGRGAPRPYLAAVGPFDPEGRPLAIRARRRSHRRSCARTIASRSARPTRTNARGYRRAWPRWAAPHLGADGYVTLNAYLPPGERRGLVLIDPPFEAADEGGAVGSALEGLNEMAKRDVYIAWRPIGSGADAHFLNSISALAQPRRAGARTRRRRRCEPGRTARTPSRAPACWSSIRPLRSWRRRGCCCRVSRRSLADGGDGEHVFDWVTAPNERTHAACPASPSSVYLERLRIGARTLAARRSRS